ncbi:MAG: glycosyltransferase [Bacteroidetes bacterium]|nr:glycosyltransferase [Bacteroidota bacterium]
MNNVLLIGSELGKGGAERSISLLSYYLEKQGYNVILCILSGTDREKFYKTCEKVLFVDPPANSGLIGKIKAWQYRIRQIKKIKKENKIDVSISFLEGPDYVNVLTKGKEKVVLSIRGSKVHDKVIAGAMGEVRKRLLIPRLYKKADEIVCVTNVLAKELHEHFAIPARKLITIYNFYEVDEIKRLANEALSKDEELLFSKPVIITSGRLHVAKEQDKLIRILKLVKTKTDARLIILGDGDLKDNFISLCEELGLKWNDWKETGYTDADVYFMGFQSNAFKYYQHSKLFALSSSWEGFPNVVAEALICNIPVVSTDCYTGPREILNVSGLSDHPTEKLVRTAAGSLLPMLNVVDNNRFQTWADEIVYWLNAPTPNAGVFTKLTSRFTLDTMLQQWQNVIDTK